MLDRATISAVVFELLGKPRREAQTLPLPQAGHNVERAAPCCASPMYDAVPATLPYLTRVRHAVMAATSRAGVTDHAQRKWPPSSDRQLAAADTPLKAVESTQLSASLRHNTQKWAPMLSYPTLTCQFSLLSGISSSPRSRHPPQASICRFPSRICSAGRMSGELRKWL